MTTKTKIIIILIVLLGVLAVALKMKGPKDVPNNADMPAAGKLNMSVVCESALAYMTFESGQAAATFIEECKAGEHPEVVERYKADHGYGNGRAI